MPTVSVSGVVCAGAGAKLQLPAAEAKAVAAAGEAAADLVVDPAARNRKQRLGRDLVLAARKQELDDRRLRELRRSAEASVSRVELAGQLRDGAV